MIRNRGVRLLERLKTAFFRLLERLYFGLLMKRVMKEVRKEKEELSRTKW